jgi:hypothetical protein
MMKLIAECEVTKGRSIQNDFLYERDRKYY